MPAAEAALPLSASETDALLAPLSNTARIALAVSGGGDSLALLQTAAGWLKRVRSPPAVVVLSVDHRLRPGSGREAEMVAAIARGRGMAARVLTWEGPRPSRDVEAEARSARYRLLLAAAREFAASHIVLAHHRDDQAETFLMRLASGSGLFGLAAMRREVRAGEVSILRPFLDVPRDRLAATAAAAGLTPVDDPMNHDPRFLRVRIRQLVPLLAEAGFGPARLAATAHHFALAADAVDERAGRLIARAVSHDGLAVAQLDRDLLAGEPAMIRSRVVARLLLAIGGEPYPPRGERLTALAEAIVGHPGGRFKRTLAGVVAEWRDGAFLFYREVGRQKLPAHVAAAAYSGIWDSRFRIDIAEDAPPGLTLGALGEAGRRSIGASSAVAPPDALAALPALRAGATIIAVPPLAYRNPGAGDFTVSVRSILAERFAQPLRFPDSGA